MILIPLLSLNFILLASPLINFTFVNFFFNDEFEDNLFDEEKVELDEDELITFLNEYYTINSDELPRAEFY
jgi:hypothetical protein